MRKMQYSRKMASENVNYIYKNEVKLQHSKCNVIN